MPCIVSRPMRLCRLGPQRANSRRLLARRMNFLSFVLPAVFLPLSILARGGLACSSKVRSLSSRLAFCLRSSSPFRRIKCRSLRSPPAIRTMFLCRSATSGVPWSCWKRQRTRWCKRSAGVRRRRYGLGAPTRWLCPRRARSCAVGPSIRQTDAGREIARHPTKPCRECSVPPQ